MTIGLGFHAVDDQILIVADRQLTSEDGFKFHEQKTFPICRDGLAIVMTYAGYPELGHSMRDSLLARLNAMKTANPSRTAVKHWLSEELEALSKGHKKEMVLELLVAVSVDGDSPVLYKTKKNIVTQGFVECIGVGDSSLIRYFTETFFRKDMPIDELLPWAVYIVAQAKEFVNGVGGKTDVAIVRPNGEWSWQHNVTDIQNRAVMVHGEVAKLLEGFANLQNSKKVFERRLKEFCVAMKKLRPDA